MYVLNTGVQIVASGARPMYQRVHDLYIICIEQTARYLTVTLHDLQYVGPEVPSLQFKQGICTNLVPLFFAETAKSFHF